MIKIGNMYLGKLREIAADMVGLPVEVVTEVKVVKRLNVHLEAYEVHRLDDTSIHNLDVVRSIIWQKHSVTTYDLPDGEKGVVISFL